MRADQLLKQLFTQYNRSQIQSMIQHGKIQFLDSQGHWQTVTKASQMFSEDYLDSFKFRIEDSEWNKFVSRAGIKLSGALNEFEIDVANLVCLDVGLSTGGFSDCLLQSGAKKIMGIDVGREQLHPQLQGNPKLLAVDKVNAREPLPEDSLATFFGKDQHLFDFIVVDVSFISLDKIIGNICNYLAPGGYLLTLVKPQFELGAEALNKKGVVKNEVDPYSAVEKNLEIFTGQNLKILGNCLSQITGDDGNKEFFIYAQKSSH